jgi:hypothetical protein
MHGIHLGPDLLRPAPGEAPALPWVVEGVAADAAAIQ